ncbi:non-ribosomal peptide synthetase [Desulfoluna butyratoxydans]|uniref:Amp-dependent synthetase/ligase n=1 Tax=Desulfoluna butyratoxydans TaxID=231438 RepID=A0A4U8YKN8_9BACT|nr:non-ribosomal peptide synthetase [Desulfoluna butyratoxydans]VFQ44456.1 amp-dependent synthetase/ligase [Desulfoluna butyratoxydans]
MSIAYIMEKLSRLDIDLWVEGGGLKYRAPKGRMTPELRRLIKLNKPGLMVHLGGSVGDDRSGPLSYNQQSLWILNRMDPDSACYNVSLSCRIVTEVRPEVMKGVCRQLVARHEILRTTYGFGDDDGQTSQTVHDTMEPEFHLVDARELSGEALKERVREYHARPFDLEKGPLLRVCLFALSGGEHIFVMTIHHIASDGSSFHLLIDEFGRLYRAAAAGEEARLAPVERQYRDFVRYQQEMLAGEEGARLEHFWRDRLSAPLPVMNLPLDGTPPASPSFTGASYPFQVTGEAYETLRTFVGTENVTLYVMLLAVFQVTLMRFCNQGDLIIGTPAVGRVRPEYKGACGHFINMVAMRGDLSASMSFREHVTRSRRVVLQALDHQAYPFPLLVERLGLDRDPSRSPLFQVMFNMLNRKILGPAADFFMGASNETPVDFGGMGIMPYPLDQEEGQYELVLEIVDNDESLACAFKYRTDLFSEETVASLASAFEGCLGHVMASPDMRLGDVPMPLGRDGDRPGGKVPRGVSPVPWEWEQGARLASGPPVTFMFTGQGAQSVRMAEGLYQGEPEFRNWVDYCADRLVPLMGCDIRRFIYPSPEEAPEAEEKLKQTAVTQPVLFTLEYALARLWMSWGVQPRAMIGHSIGEYTAACLAGVFSLDDALDLVAARGRLMQGQPGGAMLAVGLPEEKIIPFLGDGLSVAVINAPSRCVVSGPQASIQALEERLGKAMKMEGKKARWSRLRTSHAFHSEMMEPALAPFEACVAKVCPAAPRIPIVSNVTGTWLTAAQAMDPAYWSSHLREPVRFSKGVATLLTQPAGVLLEVGPGSTLALLARQQVAETGRPLILTSLRHPGQGGSDDAFIRETVISLREAGVSVDCSGEAFGSGTTPGGSSETAELAYWKETLGTDLPVLQLPVDHPRPAHLAFRGGTQRFRLSSECIKALKGRGLSEGGTVSTLLLAAYVTLLTRYSGQTDLMVGVSGADGERPGNGGASSHVFPLRADVSDPCTFDELHRRICEAARTARARAGMSLARLAQLLDPDHAPDSHPLFQAMFTFQDGPLPGGIEQGASLGGPGEPKGPACDLSLFVRDDGERWHGGFVYNAELFSAATVARICESFEVLLDAVAVGGDVALDRLPLLSRSERDKLLFEWNDTGRTYPEPVCLHEMFEVQVARTPDAVALTFEGDTLTYKDLSIRANRLAHALQKHGVGPEKRVGVFMERSVEMVVALYGTLKAGGAYVPLDPDYPSERLAFMLEDTEVPVILTQEHLKEMLPDHSATVICLDTQWETVAGEPAEAPDAGVTEDNLAYVIYTSGSTGKPKGVMNDHRGISNRLYWMQEAYDLTAEDRVLQKTPYSFDVSVWEFFWPLLFGARLVVAPPRVHKDPDALGRLIEDEGITILHFVPSMLQLFLREDHGDRCRSLTKVICSGEPLPCELRDRFFDTLSAELHNLYGPTEAAVDVTFWECKREDRGLVVPIGRPVANTQIHILDRHMEPVPVGVAGELYIGGVQVARGYMNRPKLTRDRFIPDPFGKEQGARLYKTGDLSRYLPDGQIEYLGRNDFQVKVRGLRIELGEIEAVIAGHPDVLEVVVAAREDDSGNKKVVAYVVAAHGATGMASALRGFLSEKLPEFMVPSYFVQLPAFPLMANGKVDRKALPPPTTDRPEVGTLYAAPSNDVESAIAEVWQDHLGVDNVGVDDNFFEVGGDSFLLVEVANKLAGTLKTDLKVHHLFEYPTIRAVADFLKPQSVAESAPARDDMEARLKKRKETLSRRKKNRTGDRT